MVSTGGTIGFFKDAAFELHGVINDKITFGRVPRTGDA